MRRGTLLLLVITLLLTGCAGTDGFPRDPEGTLDRVRGGVLKAGVTEEDPWVKLEGAEPTGVEVTLVERFAESIGARVEWVDGSEAELARALRFRELDLAVGGFDTKTPWTAEAAFTRPYFVTYVVVGVPRDQPVPDDIAGLRVAAETGTETAGLLNKTDAVVELVDSLDQAKGRPAAVDEWLLDDLGLHATDVRLSKVSHVMAVPLGENGFEVELERFLLRLPSEEYTALLDREGKP
jgi:polar amino acid transport system substrate-binding protein